MVLGDVEETVTTIEMDEETFEEIYKVGVCGGVGVWVCGWVGVCGGVGRYWSHRKSGPF